MKSLKKILALTLTAVLTVTALAGCGSKKEEAASSENGIKVVKIGVCGSNHDTWNAVQKQLDDTNAGIWVDIVEFDAYNLPNEALASGEIDLNAFQHVAYLNNEIQVNGYKLSTIGATSIAPLTLYSKKYGSLDDLKAAATNAASPVIIGVPNDGTNLARAIKLLETAGLITVDPAAGYTPELKDVTGYLCSVEISPVSANTLTSTLDDYGAATINGTYAIPFGLNPLKDGLIMEKQAEGSDNPYINYIVARTEDKDNPTYLAIVKAYQSQIVAEFLLEKNKGASIPAFDYNADYKTTDSFVNDIISYESPNKPK